jgi:hypothetical protein
VRRNSDAFLFITFRFNVYRPAIHHDSISAGELLKQLWDAFAFVTAAPMKTSRQIVA